MGDTAAAKRVRLAIERSAALRTIAKSRPGQQLIKTARGSRAVSEPLRFAALQLGPAREAVYRVRGCEASVLLRHRTRDIDIFNEIFGGTAGRHSYDPPPPVRALLDTRPQPRVLDIGANVGLFGAYVLSRWPKALIKSYEPDPTNMRLLRRTIAANGGGRRWSASEVAIANAPGEVPFESGLFADSRLVHRLGEQRPNGAVAGQTITVHAIDLFSVDHDVELLKMDIEGGEWPILADRRLEGLGADAIVLEWHARGCPLPDARRHAIGQLSAAGYSGLCEVDRSSENGLLWAWRERSRAARHAGG